MDQEFIVTKKNNYEYSNIECAKSKAMVPLNHNKPQSPQIMIALTEIIFGLLVKIMLVKL